MPAAASSARSSATRSPRPRDSAVAYAASYTSSSAWGETGADGAARSGSLRAVCAGSQLAAGAGSQLAAGAGSQLEAGAAGSGSQLAGSGSQLEAGAARASRTAWTRSARSKHTPRHFTPRASSSSLISLSRIWSGGVDGAASAIDTAMRPRGGGARGSCRQCACAASSAAIGNWSLIAGFFSAIFAPRGRAGGSGSSRSAAPAGPNAARLPPRPGRGRGGHCVRPRRRPGATAARVPNTIRPRSCPSLPIQPHAIIGRR